MFDDSHIVRRDARSAKYCPDVQDGEICKMTQQDASRYCKEQGGHLPNTREFAKFSNPAGVLESGYVDCDLNGNVPDGYYKVACEDEIGKPDSFYFTNEGVRQLTGELVKHSFWTSSIVLGKPAYAHVFYGALGGGGGPDHEHARSYRHAVIFVRDTDANAGE